MNTNIEKRPEIRIGLHSIPLPIPYNKAKRDDGENFGYRSILKNPSAIEEIPELINEPQMKKFVQQMHAPTGIFESVRIVHWTEKQGDIYRKILCLGFIFRDRQLFMSYNEYLCFAGHLLMNMNKGNIAFDMPFLFEIQPATLIFENFSGWIMDIYVAGHGLDESGASQRLGHILQSLRPFFYYEQ